MLNSALHKTLAMVPQTLTATFHPATYILVNVNMHAPVIINTPANTFNPQYFP